VAWRHVVRWVAAGEAVGLSQNETMSAGITGQSSGQVMCCRPNTYQSTTSVFSTDRSASVQAGMPLSRAAWTGRLPHGQRSARRKMPVPVLAGRVLGLGGAATLAANIAHGLAGRIVAA
jgi:hypothetical protein